MDMDIIRLWKVKPLQDSACVRRENYRQEGGDSTACSTCVCLPCESWWTLHPNHRPMTTRKLCWVRPDRLLVDCIRMLDPFYRITDRMATRRVWK